MIAEQVGTFVSGSSGPHHSGSGDQYISILLTADARRPPRVDPLSQEQLSWLADRFAAPPGFAEICQRLVDTRVVLLTGEAGSGARSTALMLLRRAAAHDALLHEVFDVDEPDKPALDTSAIEPKRHLFLDLSEISDDRYTAVKRALGSYCATVVERQARLVVVMRPGESTTRPELSGWLVSISRPAWRDVLFRHLEANGLWPATTDLESPELAEHLRFAPLRDFDELVQLVLKEHKANLDSALSTLLANALKTRNARRGEVRELFRAHPVGPGRALLLAAATLDELPAAAVPQATSGFLAATNYYPVEESHQLDWPDLLHQLEGIHAEIDDDLRVRFRTSGMAKAIRDHFWNVFPTLRPEPAWLVGILRHAALSSQDRDTLIVRFSDQCLRTGHPEQLESLVEQLTRAGNATAMLEHAVTALGHGLANGRYGGYYRHQIRDRATKRDLVPGLAAVMVRVCAEVIRWTHPDQALVRLHHLARWENGSNMVHACDALLDLAASRPARMAQLFERLAAGISAKHRDIDFTIFLAATDPARLADPTKDRPPAITVPIVRAQLTHTWQAALLAHPPSAWTNHVRLWLTASENGWLGDRLLPVLINAARENHTLLSQLFAIACAWACEAPNADARRRAVFDQLFHLIQEAQDLRMAANDIETTE